MPGKPIWTREAAIEAVRVFVATQGHPPGYDDFRRAKAGLPSLNTTCKLSADGSWQHLVRQAGFVPTVKPRYRPGPGAKARLSQSIRACGGRGSP